jgi:hypothetical protein
MVAKYHVFPFRCSGVPDGYSSGTKEYILSSIFSPDLNGVVVGHGATTAPLDLRPRFLLGDFLGFLVLGDLAAPLDLGTLEVDLFFDLGFGIRAVDFLLDFLGFLVGVMSI